MMTGSSAVPKSHSLLAAAAIAAVVLFASNLPAADQPNIVIILADDLGWGSLGCYGADPKLVRTPHCDRLAREGRRFTDANTPSSVCSPTRYGLLTGRYCWRTQLKHWVLFYDAPLHIETDRLNLASLLKRQGYATAAIGKWHLGYGALKANYTQPLRPGPLDIGFDYHFAVPSNHGDLTGIYVENDRVFGLRSEKLVKLTERTYLGTEYLGLDAPLRVDDQVMPTLSDRAVAWLEQQDPNKPFFLYYTPVAVHNPATPSAKVKGSSRAGNFGDWIQELDAAVGRVLDVLDRKKLTDNTLVIFTSDNGGARTDNSAKERQEDTARADEGYVREGLKVNGPFRGGKHSIFEGGFRVPFLVRWPGKVPPGTVCDETIGLVDLLATVAAVVGQKLPSADSAAEDSYNVLPAFLGKPHKSPLRPHLIVHSDEGNFAIRQGAWKYIEGKPHEAVQRGDHPAPSPQVRAAEFKPQLYNLASDPGEKQNLLEQRPDVAKRLADLLAKYRAQKHSRL